MFVVFIKLIFLYDTIFLNVSNVYAFLTNIFQSENCLIPKTSCILFTTQKYTFKINHNWKKSTLKEKMLEISSILIRQSFQGYRCKSHMPFYNRALLKLMSNVPFKELSNSHKLYFKNPYIFSTWRCKPFIF